MSKKNFLPVCLLIEGKQVCVVGGGKIAFRKTCHALDAGAKVRVIAPEISNKFEEIKDRVEFANHGFSENDINDAYIVLTMKKLIKKS
ncbi:MAG: precorrin-2 dehydrogenase/sirohydrochlorin ferrochelatase family protein [Planctomycetota bacterium]|jgi:precorrin-2 dehydrogenase/sirohydrochlorin ferrochelatase